MEIKSIKWSHINEYTLCGLKLLGQIFIRKAIVSLLRELRCTSNCCQSVDVREEIYSRYPMQSDVQSSNTEDGTVEEVNVKFNDETSGETVNVPLDLVTEDAYLPASVAIEKFLNRPVLINTYNWALGSSTTASIFPWQLYFNHTSIKKKLDNYYLLRCKLKLKFVINASPFHYGTMLVAYKPLQSFLTPAPIDTTSTGVTADLSNVAISQLPRIYIYPQTSQGGEMTLPFLYPKEWLEITTSSNTADMGQLLFRPLTPLQFANSGVGVNCTIQVFAWAEDVELSGPTVSLSMQSKRDEYGIISGPASALAEAAGMLEDAPIIGKYATATRMIASTTADVSKMFGFTNVPVIEDVHAFTPSPFPQFASPEIGTTIEKLVMDPKNELTIDPRSVGIDVGDELMINNITSRESYLTQFNWTMAGNADDILYSMRVLPYLERTAVGTSQTIIQLTPMSLVGRMFAFWRGDIKVRLKFNCSQYHKGRLRISYDPVGAIGTTVDSTTEVFTQVIDISECTDVTINVPYTQPTAFLNRSNLYTQRFSNDGTTVNDAGFSNGVLTVRILTELSAPLSTADIQCLVFVSGGDNLEFACPTDIEIPGVNATNPISCYPAQSKFEHYDISAKMVEMGDEPSRRPPTTYLKYHGEVIKSLRTLMRRTSYHTSIPFNTNALTSTVDNIILYSRLSRYPYYPGYATGNQGLFPSNKQVTGTYQYNYVKWHPLTWISQCFLGCRGSVNYRFNLNTKLDVPCFSVSRPPLTNNVYLNTSDYSNYIPSSATSSLARNLPTLCDFSGLSLTNTKTNTGLNVSIPFYSKYKFRTTSPNYPIGSGVDDTRLDWYQLLTILNPKADSNATSTYSGGNIAIYVGAGTDYSPIFFCNVPTLYQYSNNPASA